MSNLPPEVYPYLNESALKLIDDNYDSVDEFTSGLDLVLDALERDRSAAQSPLPP